MPLYEEKFLSPFAIRFSQARIRPTFQDGRVVERTMQQIKTIAWPMDSGGYDVLLNAPFPPIEIIRWRPKLREEDGSTLVDEDGTILMGEACWFTFDNRRLYCLQAAAAKQWPRRVAAIVQIMHDLPLSRCTPRKFRTTDLGCSVRISRRNDIVPRAIWSWAETVRSGNTLPEAGRDALEQVAKDAAVEDYDELIDVPYDVLQRRPQVPSVSPTMAAPVATTTEVSPEVGPGRTETNAAKGLLHNVKEDCFTLLDERNDFKNTVPAVATTGGLLLPTKKAEPLASTLLLPVGNDDDNSDDNCIQQ